MDDLDKLIEFLAGFDHDPLGFVEAAFPWGTGELAGKAGPEPWQRELLKRVGQDLSFQDAVLEAVASGHGVGKSTLVSWLILWATSTATDTRGVVTANTEPQLKTKTWPELAKWYRLFIGRELFKLEATSLHSVDPERVKTWRVDMVPWSERNPEAFAGLHNQGRRVFMIYDEASAIPDIIWETSEGFLSDQDTERLWFVFGNPTRPKGRFKACFESSGWQTTQVDSREISFTNKDQIDRWRKDYGEDSDFFRVRVAGIFPKHGLDVFISYYAVAEARERDVAPQPFDPIILGVDVARFGDDETVIVVRQGRDARSHPAVRLRGADTMQVAERVVSLAQVLRADAVFIDGGGVGGGVVDRCRQLRLDVFDIQFGGKPVLTDLVSRGELYANRRTEMWGAMRAWLDNGGGIEDSSELAKQLTDPMYGMTGLGEDVIMLERKRDMKKRGADSPDWGDALALTFALPVMPSMERRRGPQRNLVEHEYDPFALTRIDTPAGHYWEFRA